MSLYIAKIAKSRTPQAKREFYQAFSKLLTWLPVKWVNKSPSVALLSDQIKKIHLSWKPELERNENWTEELTDRHSGNEKMK